MGLSRCKSKAVVKNIFTKNTNMNTNDFALLDDDVLLSCKRKLQTSGIFKISLALLMIVCLFGQTSGEKELPDLSKIPTPPSFIHDPNPDTLYYVVEQQSLSSANGDGSKSASPSPDSNGLNLKERRFRCEASGYPKPTYRWLKNGNDFKLDNIAISDRVTRIPGTGSFIFSKLHNDDKGIYECIAENGNGTAKDKPIKFIRTSIELLHIKQESLDVEFGEPFEKDCTPPPSVPAAKAYWILMSGPSDQRRLFQTINFTNVAINDKGTIYFQYVREEDNIANYFYTCTAENVELKDYKFGYQFNFNVKKSSTGRTSIAPFIPPKEQYVSPKQITVLQGQSLELFCIFSGYPDNIPTWSKSAQELNSSRISYSTNFKKSMKIDNVGVEDEGTYLCNFENDPRLNRKFEVTVDAAPYWVGGHLPSNVNSSEGSAVEFICNAHGRPTPDFKFYKNGIQIFNDDNKYEIQGSRLTIRDIKKGDGGLGDNAVYQCNASNTYGFRWANFYLNILAFPPIVLTEDGEIETVAGKPVKLTCKVFGSPMPTVQWSSPGLLGYREKQDYIVGKVEPDGSATLELKNVKKKMEGEYKCTFQNLYNEDSSTYNVIVRNATEILLPLQSQEITIGKPLEIECLARHDPNLKVKYIWKVNGQVLESSDRIKIDPNKNKLIVENPSGFDSGKYECVAQTDLDNVSTSADIVVKDIPPSPTGVGVECYHDSAVVSFYYEERSNVAKKADKWIVQYTIDPSEPDAWDTYVTDLSQLEGGRGRAKISLFPFGQFAFRVLARNEIGSSVPAYADAKSVENGVNGRCETNATAPAYNPDKVEIQPNVDGDLIVNWEPVPRRNWYGPKFEYVVQYKPSKDEDAAYKNKSIEDPYQKSTVIDDVEPHKEYDVLVWSKNEKGMASKIPTTTSGRSGETAPTIFPSGFEVIGQDGPSSANFRWNPINKEDIDGEFKGYKIVHWTASAKRSEPTRKEAYFDSEAKEGTVFDLKPNKENFAQIMVYSNAGDGPPSPTLSFKMPEGVPTPVQDVSVFPISHNEIGVLWKPPREVNGNLTGYEIKVCPIKNEKVVESECLPPKEVKSDDLTESRIKDLEAATPYLVELRGKTNSGLGDPVSFETNTTINYDKDHPAAPSPPSVENVQIGHDHINVTWKPGSYDLSDPNSKPPGEGFFVKYRRDGDGDDAWIAVNESTGTGLSVTLKDLSPATKYEVRTVSIRESSAGRLETESGSHYFTTAGEPSQTATVGWLIAIIIAIIILVIILIIVCLVVRNRGAKYPVSEKEKEQGREPMLKDEKGFGEYAKPDVDEEKRSLTAESLKPESETDSMAEYGDGETGRFTEDGSFIGQYGAANKTTAPERGKPNLSTFV